MPSETILVTGATGYIGGRLVPLLLAAGYAVRCFVRNPEQLRNRTWEDQVEIVKGDVLQPDTLAAALAGIDAAYYLIHSLQAGEAAFAERDRQAAANFGKAAREAGLQRIICLGGLKPKTNTPSKHLKSRLETGDILRASGVPVTEFRAAVIVGSGSLSFEMIRYLTERVPLLITPRWVRTPTQPIAIRNVLQYLTQALTVPESTGKILEIGGKDVLTYGDMFRIYARVRGLRHPIVEVPVLTPRLSSLWVGLVTPINSRIARLLIDGLNNEVVVQDDTAQRLFDIELFSYETAVQRALTRFERDEVETMWSGAVSSNIDDVKIAETLTEKKEGMIRERLQVKVKATPETVFGVIKSLGGDTGWLYADALWKIRGFLDLLIGGIGLRKTRRSYTYIRESDTIDFWRVEAVEENRLLRLRAEMKVPGKAWLQYKVKPDGPGCSIVTQTAFYEPRGLFGFLYWYLFALPHRFIFPGMLRALRRRAEALEVTLKNPLP